jgi:GT2 family glycosyltransferase
LNGSAILLRSEALQEIGSFDERFFIFYEDTDLGVRFWQAGWRSVLATAAGMVHLGHETVSTPALTSVMARQMLRSQWLYVRKHHGRPQAGALTRVVRGALLLRSVRAAMRGTLRADPTERELARHLIALAGYQPSAPLPHEEAR